MDKRWYLIMASLLLLCNSIKANLTITQTTARLSQARYSLASGTAGNLVYFAGGAIAGGDSSAVVDVYDSATSTWLSSLRGEVSPLTKARQGLSSASANNRVFFAGGVNVDEQKDVDVFDATGLNFSQTTITGTPYAGRATMASDAANGKVYFAGGGSHGSQLWMELTTDYVDEFDPLTLSKRTMNLSTPRSSLAGASVDNKVIFAGGHYIPLGGNFSISSSRVDIYDTISGTWSTDELSVARQGLVAASLTDAAVFAGGSWTEADGKTYHVSSAVDIFDALTNTWTTSNLSEARSNLAGIGLGNLAFFAGGLNEDALYSNIVDVYDFDTDQWSTLYLSEARYGLTAAVLGNQVFFAGGFGLNGYSNTIDIFTINYSQPIPAPGAIVLAGIGAGMVGWLRRRKSI